MRSERKKGRAFLARFMVLLMVINLLSGINPSAVRAEENFNNPGSVTGKDDNLGITINKEVVSEDSNGDFNIKLTVEGADKVNQMSKPLDVVLVVDTSGSMEGPYTKDFWSFFGGQGKPTYKRINNAKNAAKDFVDKIAAKHKDNTRIALISFAGTAEVKSGLTKDYNVLRKQIDTLKEDGATFTQDALRKANALLTNSTGNKVIVLISDGEPTYAFGKGKAPNFNKIERIHSKIPDTDKYAVYSRYWAFGWNWKKGYKNTLFTKPYKVELMDYAIGDGVNSTEIIKNHTITEANQIKENGTKIFAVGMDLNSDGKKFMNSIDSDGKFKDAGETGETLQKIMDDILEDITKRVKGGIITDPMSEYVEYVEGTAKSSNKIVKLVEPSDTNNNTLTVSNINLGKDEKIEVIYKVRLKENYKDGKYYKTNGTTKLLPYEGATLMEFNVPEVKSKQGVTISFTVTKEWKNTPVYMRRNARVQLFSGLNENDQKATNEIRRIDANTENTDSKVKFENLPAYKNGAKIVYTVKELDDKGEYVENNQEFKLNGNIYKVKYEVTPVENTFNIVNTNCDNKFNVSVEKKWTGKTTEASFELMKNAATAVEVLDELTLTGNDKRKTFTKELDRYDENGNLIKYIVREKVPNGYVLAGSNDVAVTFDNPVAKFENVNIQENISFTLKKRWVGGIASSAKFIFTNDVPNQAVEATQSIEIDGKGNEWTKTVTLPRYNKDGSEATYTVTEEPIPGFSSKLSKDEVDKATTEITATNTLKSNETVDIDIEKIWKGNIPEGAKRSVDVEVQKKNEKDEWVKFKSYTLTPVTGWNKSAQLPKYNGDGAEAEYRIVETAINGEEITVPTDISNGYTHRVFNINIDKGSVTNTFEDIKQPKESDKRNIRVVKTWVNAKDNQKKPVRVTLYKIVADKNGNSTLEKVDELPLNSGNNWIGEFKNVDRYVGMEATETPANPTTTNEQETPATEIQTPANPAEGNGEAIMPTTPAPVTENGTTEEQPVVEPTPAAPAVSNEPIARANKNANKVKAMAMAPTVKYVVIETEIDGKGFENITPDEETNDYELNGCFVSIESDLDKGCNTVFVFNEPKEQEESHVAKVIATKVWDTSAKGKEKPVVFTLYCDMDNKWVATDKTVTLSGKNNNWTAVFDNLPEKDEHGESILYYVFETQIGDTVIENLPNALSENVTYTTGTIDGGKYTVKITVEGNENSEDIIDKVTITNSYTANTNPGGGGGVNPGGGTGGGDNPGGSNPGTEPVVPVQDPTPDTTPTVDVPDDTTPQGDANINPDTDNDDEDTDDADDDVLEVDNDDVPQGTAKTKDDAVKEDPIDVDGDPTPRGNANLPKTGGTTADFLSIIGLGLVGLGLVIKRRK